jgi:predicted N-acetyltransferase YhbS
VRAIEEVHDLPGSFGMVAIDRDTMVGHAQFSRAWVGRTPALVLGPLGVTPTERGRGIGSG